jgi:hypothetical protein
MRGAISLVRLGAVLLALLLPGFAQRQYVGTPISDPLAPPPPLAPETSTGQQLLSGWFHMIWEDPPPDSGLEPAIRYVLIDDQNQWFELLLNEELVRSVGEPLVFNRKRIKIVGEAINFSFQSLQTQPELSQVIQVQSIELEQLEGNEDALSETYLQAVAGSQP